MLFPYFIISMYFDSEKKLSWSSYKERKALKLWGTEQREEKSRAFLQMPELSSWEVRA